MTLEIDNNLNKFAQECDNAIDSNNIQEIDLKIETLTSMLSQNSSDLESMQKKYILGNLFLKKSKLMDEKYNEWRDKVYPKNGVSAINYFRKALESSDLIEHYMKFEVKTNLANSLTQFKRDIEAIQLWPCDFSLPGDSAFVSSYRKACTLLYLAQYIEDKQHSGFYFFKAYNIFRSLQDNSGKVNDPYFRQCMTDPTVSEILSCGEQSITRGAVDIEDMQWASGSKSKGEKSYRKWCLDNCLFLNHLNDITVQSVAAKDIIQFPVHHTSIEDGPYFLAAFSAIKREYSYARFTLYEGIFEKNCPQYESLNLYLTDTGDEIDYSLSVEKIKAAFRLVFSILDKLALLMTIYFNRGDNRSNASFSPSFIRKHFNCFDNPFITSLFWLSCDLTDIDPTASQRPWKAPDPDAKKIRKLRNELEHKWLRVADGFPAWGNKSGFDYASIIAKEELCQLTLKSFRMVRSAILYFVFSVIYHERSIKNDSNTLSFPQENPLWSAV